MSTEIEAHIIHPEGPHRLSIIWLHGLGADGFDFVPIVPKLDVNPREVKFIFPHAPIRPISINNGFPMRGWYDIFSLKPENFVHDLIGIRASALYVQQLIEREVEAGIAPEQIILAGFSQGGAIALFVGLTGPVRVGGILALSTYLPAPEVVGLEKRDNPPPVLMMHGSEDQIILLQYAELSRDVLREMNCQVEFNVYPMGHSLCEEEVQKISEWLKGRI